MPSSRSRSSGRAVRWRSRSCRRTAAAAAGSAGVTASTTAVAAGTAAASAAVTPVAATRAAAATDAGHVKGPGATPDAALQPLHMCVVNPPTTNHAPPILRCVGPESSTPEESFSRRCWTTGAASKALSPSRTQPARTRLQSSPVPANHLPVCRAPALSGPGRKSPLVPGEPNYPRAVWYRSTTIAILDGCPNPLPSPTTAPP
ncbi:hypothetical protein F1721_06115 [Saccharopolyspora hirsuta]|uniref:Uncharacterized protein n=1 Tax=Saccharopolyspora hirsuta TaxID=1837 RepID=A0A5M7C3A9_SACHI|nr:hypothetical protein F1721_06115 [Saccharopolyspora hirsuta]